MTKGATYTTAEDVGGAISAAVGDLGDKEPDVPYANVKEYVDEKISDVVAGSIEGLGELASKDEVAEVTWRLLWLPRLTARQTLALLRTLPIWTP
mgnify:FL=1